MLRHSMFIVAAFILLTGFRPLAAFPQNAGHTAAEASDRQANSKTPVKPARKYVCPPCEDTCHEKAYEEPGRCPICNMRLVEMEPVRHVAVLIYDGLDPLEFTGPTSVLARTQALGYSPFRVYTVAMNQDVVHAGYLTVKPDYAIDKAPTPEIILVPGGAIEKLLASDTAMAWLNDNGLNAELVLSIGTGSLALAKCGMLDGVPSTSSPGSYDRLRAIAPETRVTDLKRIVDNGDIMTACGASAGIDAGLHIVKRLIGDDIATKVAAEMSYDWIPEFDYGLVDYVRDTGITDRLMPYVNELIEKLEQRMAAGRLTTSNLLRDPTWLFVHELPRFREAVRKYADAEPLTLVTEDEPGERIEVSGVVKDESGKPVAGAVIYAYHTDTKGVYSSKGGNTASMGDSLNPRLFGYIKTRGDGKYTFKTIRPGGYPDGGPPAHIHFEIRADGYQDLVTEMMFEGDKRLTAENHKGLEESGFQIVKIEEGKCGADWTLRVKG